jgi:hypothetical protein
MDPRVKPAPGALNRLFDAEQRLTNLITQTTQTIRIARSVAKQLGESDQKAHAILADLNKLNAQVLDCYADIDSADAAPTTHQTAALSTLSSATTAALTRWQQFIREDIPVLNRSRTTPILLTPDDKEDEDTAH